ncbi:cytochrome P450 [Streptomyces sp. NPDC091280]|uniref:cytochrome P450 n=1 Tax=Streptomyces sp. NPDC091280 TaxID=3365984 RepID=UPI0037FC6FFB
MGLPLGFVGLIGTAASGRLCMQSGAGVASSAVAELQPSAPRHRGCTNATLLHQHQDPVPDLREAQLGNGAGRSTPDVSAFATHSEHWQRLRERPELARVAFDEAVRWQPPVQTFFRTATTDARLAGTLIPEGTKILMFLGAANRDPDRDGRKGVPGNLPGGWRHWRRNS